MNPGPRVTYRKAPLQQPGVILEKLLGDGSKNGSSPGKWWSMPAKNDFGSSGQPSNSPFVMEHPFCTQSHASEGGGPCVSTIMTIPEAA